MAFIVSGLAALTKQKFLENGVLACTLKKNMVLCTITYPKLKIFAEARPRETTKESSDRACGLVSKANVTRKAAFRLTFQPVDQSRPH